MRPSADVARVAAISRDSGTNPRIRISLDDTETDGRVHAASSRIEANENEWWESESVYIFFISVLLFMVFLYRCRVVTSVHFFFFFSKTPGLLHVRMYVYFNKNR